MNNKKSSVPKLRFPEFTDAWEQRKLKDFSQKVIEKNVDNKYTETLTNSAEFGIINQRDFFDKDISNATNLTSYYIVQNNDFVYNPRISNLAPVGPIKRNKLGRTGVMSPLYYVFRITDVNPTFLEIFFETSIWHRFMKENGDSGARSDRFAIKDSIFIEMPIYIPQSQEQQKIGSFFTALDRLITTHQRKLENVKKLKKSLLQKMFPKNGQEFPEIRFPEFTDAWEQRKLGKLADCNPRSNLPDEFKYVDLESVVGTELTGYRFENKLSAPSRAQRLAQKGDIFYQTVRPYQKNNYLFEFEDENFVFSTGYAQLRPLINGRFLFSKLQEDRFVQQVLDKCTGTSYPAINSSDLSEIKVYIPDNKQEQQKIGSFFTALDRLITTHQRKLENVKNLKKALLQQMFV
ncbi:restriction endonuclease subunit S [Pasteurella sp. PK-2025]|uniref:restriction endonuclease subunit S n=1 Tax=Pasteurella sp. PK-2025 TaxID=3413133 RepID=UPI003C783575